MKRPALTAAIVVVLLACVGAGVFLAVRSKPAPPAQITKPPTAEVPAGQSVGTVKVYHVVVENNRASLRPVAINVNANQDPVEIALKGLIEHKEGRDLGNPIPKGTRLLGLKIEEGVARVNLSREFVDNFTGGSEDEGLTVNAILTTLGQFPNIERVRLMVDGKPLDSLGGHLDLSGALSVIRTSNEARSTE